MRKLLLLILLCVSTLGFALPLRCLGKAAQVVHQGDTVYLFDGEIEMTSPLGNVDWYSIETGLPVQTNTDDVFLDDGGYWMQTPEGERHYFYVFDYQHYMPHDISLTVTPMCRSTHMQVEGQLPDIAYVNKDGYHRVLPRACTIEYTDLGWSEAGWVDSVVTVRDTVFHLGEYVLPPICQATTVRLQYEQLMDSFDIQRTEAMGDLVNPVAIRTHMIATTTTRPGEKSNEVNRPTRDTWVTEKLKGSAPMDVLFSPNATPTAQFYKWEMYHYADFMMSRNEPELRYTFTEPGTYKVVCHVSNMDCPCQDASSEDCTPDSIVTEVVVCESMLEVPNVFTPNGDGQNAEFRVLYCSLREFHCWVYNRWGHLVYEWTDPAKGWDGNIGGRPAPAGAYFYVIRAMGTDADRNARYRSRISYDKAKRKNSGDSSIDGDNSLVGIYQLSGDINLLR